MKLLNRLYFLIFFLAFYNLLSAQVSYSKQYLQQIANKKTVTAFDSLMVKGAALAGTDTAQALQYFLQALDIALNEKSIKNRVFVNVTIGEMFLDKQTLRKAYVFFSRARSLTVEDEVSQEALWANFGVARTQFLAGNYRPSVLNFLLTIYLSQHLKERNIESEAMEYLGQVYSSFQDYKQTISFYKRSYDLKKSLNDDKGCLRIAEKLGDIYTFNRRFDSAYYYVNLALQISETLNLTTDIALARLNKAAVLIRLKKMKEAEDELLFFNSVAKNKDTEGVKPRLLTIQGNYQLQKGNRKAAMVLYDSAVNLAGKYELAELYTYVYRNMAESFYDIQDFKTAYDYAQKYTDHIKTMNTRGRNLNLESVQRYFDVNASKDEIKLLNYENQLKELQLQNASTARQSLLTESLLKDSIILKEKALTESINREFQLQQLQLSNERKLRLSLIFGLTSALLLGVLVFFLYQKQKRKNSIIAKQSEDLETLMKEIHHRVKNNLQVISSLLDLQSMSIKDEAAASAIKEGKNRVQSMALIHQNLYDVGNIKSVKMDEYIVRLAKSLFDSYNIEPERIKLKTEIDPLSLDIDTVIPIGLTLNELITNSLKYAFIDKNNGEIMVKLVKDGSDLLLNVQDNGIGFTNSELQRGNREGTLSNTDSSFGFKIVKAFAQKLKAQLIISNNNGACVEIRIKKFKLA